MAQDCGLELRKENVTMVSLWPGAVQTERMVETVNKPEALQTEVSTNILYIRTVLWKQKNNLRDSFVGELCNIRRC